MPMKTTSVLMKGFTLIEMMLVMVIVSAILYMGMGYLQQRMMQLRLDKASAQMQQIMSAALSYYARNGSWPADLNCLKGIGCSVAYLPPVPIINPFWPGGEYYIYPGNQLWWPPFPSTGLYVVTYISAPPPRSYAIATSLAGMLPSAFTTPDGYTIPCDPSGQCWVIASVPEPGQNLSNATSVNFAGLYHNGACVPVPNCPLDASGTPLKPKIMVVPVSVTGVGDAPTLDATCNPMNTSGCAVNAYPLNSFTASATANALATAGSGPAGCLTNIPAPCYNSYDINGSPVGPAITTGQYWRVCLSVATQKGVVSPTGALDVMNTWGQISGTVLAITRCAMPEEEPGSGFTVWSP